MSVENPGALRIGLVCPYAFDAPGGVQNHVRGLARHLRAQGHDPHILAPGEVDEEYATSAGAPVAVRYNGSTARVNFGPLSAARVRRWLRAGGFDLLHIHEPVTPSISMLALWAAEVPVVATFHTATPRSRSMQLAGGALRAAIEKIDAGIAVSESARQVVVQHLGRDALLIPNGFSHHDFACHDLAASAVSRPQRAARRHPRLAFLGRLDEPRKGLGVLLDALPMLQAEFPQLEAVIAGQGQRRMPPGCRAVGLVTDRQKAELLAASDVFVAPHLARESFGIVLLEAMASGTAVVASDLDAFSDILRAPAGSPLPALGSMFAVGSSASLAGAVRGVLRQPNPERLALASAASKRYDWSVVGAAITEVYRATVELAGPAAQNVVRR